MEVKRGHRVQSGAGSAVHRNLDDFCPYLVPLGFGLIKDAASIVTFAVPVMQLGLNPRR